MADSRHVTYALLAAVVVLNFLSWSVMGSNIHRDIGALLVFPTIGLTLYFWAHLAKTRAKGKQPSLESLR